MYIYIYRYIYIDYPDNPRPEKSQTSGFFYLSDKFQYQIQANIRPPKNMFFNLFRANFYCVWIILVIKNVIN